MDKCQISTLVYNLCRNRERENMSEKIKNEEKENGMIKLATFIVDKRNLRNLVDMSHQRMCTRAYLEYRRLFNDICNALREYSDEWKWIVDNLFIPKCEQFGYCTEKKSCGRKDKGVILYK